MTSPQAMVAYTKLEREDELVKDFDKIVAAQDKPTDAGQKWPYKGRIEF
jgi:hypothetical protein